MQEPGSCCFLVQMKSGAVTSTWVGTLLEVDGRAPCTDGDAGADVDADADAGETSFLGLKESEIQTIFFIMESPIGRTFSCANSPPITKDIS